MKKRETERAAGHLDEIAIVHAPVEALNAAPYNPRKMSAEERVKLRRSMARFGCVEPLVVQKGTNVVIGGHQRLEIAKELGWSDIPIVHVDASDNEARLLNLALNRISGEWDTVKLASLLSELRTLPTSELELSGFLKDETTAIIRALDWGRRFSPDNVPDPPEVPTAKPGDLWQLGDHFLLCADSTDPEAVQRLLSGRSVDLLPTDPPYGISYDPGERPGARTPGGKIEGDSLPDEDYSALLEGSLKIAFAAASGGAPAYVFHASTQADIALAAFRAAGWRLSACLIWVKTAPTFGRGDYHWQHEPILYGWRPGGHHHWFGGRSESTVWQIGTGNASPDSRDDHHLHPNQKPVVLLERAISNSSRPGDTVYDPFVGSGSTVVACERTARRCLAVEVDPRFVDVAVRRWEQYADQAAELVRRA